MLSNQQLNQCLSIANLALEARGNEDVNGIWQQMRALCRLDGMLLGLAELTTTNQHNDPIYGHFGCGADVLSLECNNDWIGQAKVTKSSVKSYALNQSQQVFELRRCHPGSCIVSLVSVVINTNRIGAEERYLIETLLPHVNVMLSRPGFLNAPKLTDRERQILVNVNQGFTHDQVAELVGVTRRTVCFHLSNIYRKYEVNDKVSAVNKAKLYGELLAA